MSKARGERVAQSKLTAANVVQIRAIYRSGDVSQRFLAAEYGVAHSTIGRIVRRAIWRHVGDERREAA